MKTFISSIAVAVVLLTGIGTYIYYLNTTTEAFSALTAEIFDCAEKEQWETGDEKMKSLEEKWKAHKGILCAFTDHGDLDKIEQTICELKESFRYRNKENAARYASVLLALVERLKDNESLTWENILRHTPKKQTLHKML